MKFLNLTLLCSITALSACNIPKQINGSGSIDEKNYSFNNIQNIEIEGEGEVFINFDNANTVSVIGDDNIVTKVEVTNTNNVIVIKPKKDHELNPDQPLQYFISANLLDNLDAEGDFEIEIDSIDQTNATFTLTGDNELTINGHLENLTLNAFGDNEFNSNLTNIETLTALIEGDNEVTVNVSDRIDLTITGDSQFFYSGSPSTSFDITGSATVKNQ